MPPAGPVHLHAVGAESGFTAVETGDEKSHFMTPGSKSAERFVKVDLRSTGLWIRPVLPVDDEQSQRASPVPAPT
jgi:hypothetical protein